ncbi:MAG TPA: hypothetical protein VFE24_04620 [Pirellulales bacterium]|jgi:hypothetical protein|nr:hypothetical protein [Pirellulales bacterium]
MLKRTLVASLVGFGTLAMLLAGGFQIAHSCPFCTTISLTFSEEIDAATVAVFAKMVEAPAKPKTEEPASGLDVAPPVCKLQVLKVLKGGDLISPGKVFEAVYFGDAPVGSEFFVKAIDPPKLLWSSPTLLTDRVKKYLLAAMKLPKEGPDRLAFFQGYLEDKEEMLNRDAYDEFAKVPYSGIRDLKEKMDHDKVLGWVTNPEIPASRRRLYFTMLSVCGTKQDVPALEAMLRSPERKQKTGLDALISCYLMLRGPEGMSLVEDLFIKNKKAEYVDTYAAVMALRFQGQESTQLPKERILEAFRLMLDRPDLADLVIPDLARWQDWSVMDRLVELFKKADDSTNWIRMPVVNFLRACPEPKAKAYLKELAAIDPETIKRAAMFFPLGDAAAGMGTAVPAAAATSGRPAKPLTDGSAVKGVKTENSKAKDSTPGSGQTAPVGAPKLKSSYYAPVPAAANSQASANSGDRVRVADAGGASAPAPHSVLSPDSPWFYVLTGGLAVMLVMIRRTTHYWAAARS